MSLTRLAVCLNWLARSSPSSKPRKRMRACRPHINANSSYPRRWRNELEDEIILAVDNFARFLRMKYMKRVRKCIADYTTALALAVRKLDRTTKIPAVVIVAPAYNGRFDEQSLLVDAFREWSSLWLRDVPQAERPPRLVPWGLIRAHDVREAAASLRSILQQLTGSPQGMLP